MTWVSAVRAIGVLAGVALVVTGAAWLISELSDPPTQQFDVFVLLSGSLIAPGVLLAAPWSRIRPFGLWYSLFAALVLVGPFGVALILAVNTWSAMHGAGGEGFALVSLIVVGWAIQLPAIWSLRPRRN
jgi:hypothetical protein